VCETVYAGWRSSADGADGGLAVLDHEPVRPCDFGLMGFAVVYDVDTDNFAVSLAR